MSSSRGTSLIICHLRDPFAMWATFDHAVPVGLRGTATCVKQRQGYSEIGMRDAFDSRQRGPKTTPTSHWRSKCDVGSNGGMADLSSELRLMEC